jgi:hypothetical protein
LVTQETLTFVTLAPEMVPLPFVTVHVWFGVVGCVSTVTEYELPVSSVVSNVNAPFADTVSLSPPLFCSTTLFPAARPLTVPPTV